MATVTPERLIKELDRQLHEWGLIEAYLDQMLENCRRRHEQLAEEGVLGPPPSGSAPWVWAPWLSGSMDWFWYVYNQQDPNRFNTQGR